MLPRRSITLIIHREGALESKTVHLPVGLLRLLVVGGAVLAVLIVLGAALYLPLVRTAARVPGLVSDVKRLEADNAKIRQLVVALDSAESRYSQIRGMLGGEIVPDPVARSSRLPVAPPIRVTPAAVRPDRADGASVPAHWPLDDQGYVTRGQVGTGTRDEAHPGIDIAVPAGSLVRASASGKVLQAGSDPEYGSFVLLEHADGYQTMYGHLSRIIVTAGQTVESGQVIALSGNSGRSSAPHLHFEIRRGGKSLDPLTMVREGA